MLIKRKYLKIRVRKWCDIPKKKKKKNKQKKKEKKKKIKKRTISGFFREKPIAYRDFVISRIIDDASQLAISDPLHAARINPLTRYEK